jgi:hypothetical protein
VCILGDMQTRHMHILSGTDVLCPQAHLCAASCAPAGAPQCLRLQATPSSTRGLPGPRLSPGQAVAHAPQPDGQGVSGPQQGVSPATVHHRAGPDLSTGPHVPRPSCCHAGERDHCWSDSANRPVCAAWVPWDFTIVGWQANENY